MTLTQLRYIVAIADNGLNITQAAGRLHTTQSTISKQLKQLENELGFPVFERNGKQLQAVTSAGQQVLQHARTTIAGAHTIEVLAANLRGDAGGELVLVTTHTQARFMLPRHIGAFRTQHENVSLHIRPHSDAQVQSLFLNGEADMAIISSSGKIPMGGLAIPLYRWQRLTIVPRDHPLATLAQPLSLEDLATQPLVTYESALRPRSSMQRAFNRVDLTPQFACTSSDADLIKTYVEAGLGVGILAEMAILPADKKKFRVIDTSHLLPDCITWLVLRRGRLLRPYEIDFAAQFLPQLDRNALQRAIDGGPEPEWPQPLAWQDFDK